MEDGKEGGAEGICMIGLKNNLEKAEKKARYGNC